MRTAELMYGTKLAECVQNHVAIAHRSGTAESYASCADKLRGIQSFLVWTETGDAETSIVLSNHIRMLMNASDRAPRRAPAPSAPEKP